MNFQVSLHLNNMIRVLLVFFAIVCSSMSYGKDSVVVIVEIRSATEDETVQNVVTTIEIGGISSYISALVLYSRHDMFCTLIRRRV